jgi:hypothetical protein
VYSEKLLMMDRGALRNMLSFIPKINFKSLVYLVGFILRIFITMHGHLNVKLTVNLSSGYLSPVQQKCSQAKGEMTEA